MLIPISLQSYIPLCSLLCYKAHRPGTENDFISRLPLSPTTGSMTPLSDILPFKNDFTTGTLNYFWKLTLFSFSIFFLSTVIQSFDLSYVMPSTAAMTFFDRFYTVASSQTQPFPNVGLIDTHFCCFHGYAFNHPAPWFPTYSGIFLDYIFIYNLYCNFEIF